MNKKITSFLSLVALTSASALSFSCSKSQESQSAVIQKFQTETQEEKDERNWENFLSNEFVNNFLNLIYENKDEKEKFIQEQKEIDSNTEFSKLKNWLYYWNTVENKSDDPVWSPAKPLPFKKARDGVSDFANKNWLFFLFNIQKIVFMQLADTTNLFDGTKEELTENSRANLIDHPLFYKPSTNEIIDYSIFKEVDNLHLSAEELEFDDFGEYTQEYKAYLLNKDGYIFEIKLSKRFDENKKLTSQNIQFSLWLDRFKNFSRIKTEDLKSYFNIKKYSQEKESQGTAQGKSAISFNIFKENYGGEPLRYAFSDIQK
ncbi:aromatic motif membrane protein [Mycoplasma procyoni]|uniref:aromatic motif membrane protein n=1 Tax=Mycoplasma procyoni TaxID=568784 RepID=UPI00197C0A56|nr:aromatic motif membrane protein [Mycoplasma procyoni]MBN3534869.1 hypothetical protein [Mycoplasma procyoni]